MDSDWVLKQVSTIHTKGKIMRILPKIRAA